jgi:hypothetical protein
MDKQEYESRLKEHYKEIINRDLDISAFNDPDFPFRYKCSECGMLFSFKDNRLGYHHFSDNGVMINID